MLQKSHVQSLGVVVALCGLLAHAFADVPLMMPMQGAIRDNAGVPVATGTFEVTFALYTSETGGSPVWTENWPPAGTCADGPNACVAVQSGAFHVLLGTHVPLDPSVFAQAPELWLGMKVETDPELPRRRMGSTGYALHAASADIAGGIACSGCIDADKFDQGSLNTAISAYLGVAGYLPGVGYSDDDVLALLETEGYQKKSDPILPSQLPPDVLGSLDVPFADEFDATFTVAPAPPYNVIKGFNFQADTWTNSIPDLGPAVGISVSLELTHTNAAELLIELVPPTGVGSALTLHDHSLPGVTHMMATWTDQDEIPSGSLSDLIGKSLAGTWTLEIFDSTAPPANDGALVSWTMTITYLSGSTTKLTKTLVLENPVVDAFTAAELIDASSEPRVVWYDGAGAGVRVASASVPSSTTQVIGVATLQPQAELGNRVLVQTHGVVGGFIGLTVGESYYLAGEGAVASVVGNTNKFIGTAVGPTTLLLQLRQQEQEASRLKLVNVLGKQDVITDGQSVDFTLEIECGFIPRSFDGMVHFGIVWDGQWNSGSGGGKPLVHSTHWITAEVGGDFVGFGVREGPLGATPTQTPVLFPYVSSPEYISGATSSPTISHKPQSGGSTFLLKSIKASGTKLVFTFSYLHDGGILKYGVRYGVRTMTVRG